MGPRAGLNGYGKSRPPPGFDPQTIQPAASRYSGSINKRHSVCQYKRERKQGNGQNKEGIRQGSRLPLLRPEPRTLEHEAMYS